MPQLTPPIITNVTAPLNSPRPNRLVTSTLRACLALLMLIPASTQRPSPNRPVAASSPPSYPVITEEENNKLGQIVGLVFASLIGASILCICYLRWNHRQDPTPDMTNPGAPPLASVDLASADHAPESPNHAPVAPDHAPADNAPVDHTPVAG